MVFQSVPLFLDPPNWHHQEQNQQPLIPNHDSLLHVIPQPPTTTGAVAGGSGGAGMGSIRPGSMADRARLAKLPQPEPGLKCPRCESTNTKFCYFNNYSLSQPRHFCKTCRRYWTRGGALRNVPVGGGCRRSNKRSKRSNSRSKSPITAMTDRSCGSINNTNLSCSSTSSIRGSGGRGGGGGLHNMNSHLTSSLQPQLPFLLGGYGPSDIGLHTGGIQPPPMAAGGGGSADMNFQMGGSSSGGLISSHHQPFRLPLHQFPFLTGLEEATPPPPPHAPQLQPPGNELYPFQGSNHNVELIDSGAKMEENDHEGLALSSKNFLEIHGGNDQYNWSTNGGNAWPDLL